MKRIQTLLAVLLLLSLTACNIGKKTREIHKVDWVISPAYTAEEITLPVQTGDPVGCCTDGEYMYILADEKAENVVHSVLSRVSLSDGTAEVLERYQTPEVSEDSFLHQYGPILAPDGTLWVSESWVVRMYDLPEDFNEETDSKMDYLIHRDEFLHLRQLDPATGREQKLVDLSEAVQALELESIFDVSGFAVDEGGNIYLSGPGGVSVLNDRGKLLFTLAADTPYYSVDNCDGGRLVLLPDGSVAALTIQPGCREVRIIDPATKSWKSERYELPNSVDIIFRGTGGFLFFYLSSGNFYGWEPEEPEGRILLTQNSLDLPGGIMCFTPMDGGKLAALTTFNNAVFGEDEDYWYFSAIRLHLLSPSAKAPNEGKMKLVYGTLTEDRYLRYRIDQFNKSNDQYYIELRNYSGEGVDLFGNSTPEKRNAATTRLHAEVVSGKIPDIWDKSLPLDLYARKGYFEDLWPFIDGDTDLGGRDALMSHVLECASVDGKLYKIADSFSIDTIAVSPSFVGDRTSWTLDEMMKIYHSMPEGSSLMQRSIGGDALLRALLEADLDHWVNWSTGECAFNTQEFKNLLEVCVPIQEEAVDWETYDFSKDIRAGRQLMTTVLLSGPNQLTQNDVIFGGPEHLMDYYNYLRSNHVTFNGASEDGYPGVSSAALKEVESCMKTGKVHGYWPLSSHTVIGALEGGGYCTYIGYPTQEGSGNSFTLPSDLWDYLGTALSMSATCQHKDAAWEFMRQILLPVPRGKISIPGDARVGTYTRDIGGFPMNKATFEEVMSPRWLTYKDENEEEQYLLDSEGNRMEDPYEILMVFPGVATKDTEIEMVVMVLAPNETQMKQFWSLYNSIDRVETNDKNLLSIILEQAGPFFAGDKSADETADLIQRRATLYVNENR